MLSDQEFLRYDRQISIRGFDIDGQEKLKDASALVIGLGGLGCAATQYLAAAGIGKLTLVDFDIVSESNLHRQILHQDSNVKQLKVASAAETLRTVNPYLQIATMAEMLDDAALLAQVAEHDIVLDCSDNLATRQQINRCCHQQKVPLISAAAIRMEGLLTVFRYQADEPCYYCLSRLFGDDDLTCVETGVMSPLVGMIGSMQALEAIKLLTNFGQVLVAELLTVDGLSMSFNKIKFSQSAACPVCHPQPNE